MAFCFKCGGQLSAGAEFCTVCGTRKGSRIPSASAAYSKSQPINETAGTRTKAKRKPIVILLAIFPGIIGIWGIGHMYAGQVKRGIVFLVCGLLLGFVAGFISVFSGGIGSFLFTLVFAVFIFQIFDAYRTAKKLGIE